MADTSERLHSAESIHAKRERRLRAATERTTGTMIQQLFRRGSLQAGMAELVGTFFLTLAALIAGTPYAVALTLAAFVYAFGRISGCNLNPGVTVGLMAGRRLPLGTGILYLIAQVAGALLARGAALLMVGTLPAYHAAGPWAEGLGFAFLMLTVVAVSDKYVPQAGSGLRSAPPSLPVC